MALDRTPIMVHPIRKLDIVTGAWLKRAATTLCSIIDRYAIAMAIAKDDYRDDYVTNDFFYYCLTKSTKTLVGINALIEKGLGEDAQILIRSAYENYLAISFLLANLNRLDDLVEKKIGVNDGYFKHPLNTKGKKDRRKIIDPRSGEVLQFDVSIAEMASSGRHPEDREMHWPFYGYLSEHCHPHMMASGNYRDDTEIRYSYKNNSQSIQAKIYATYVFLLLLAETKYFEKLKTPELSRTNSLLKTGVSTINRALGLFIFEAPLEKVPNAMKNRINKVIVKTI